MSDRLVHPAGPDGDDAALLIAAAAAGHGPRVRALLDGEWWGSVHDDGELMRWAADYGAYQLMRDGLVAHAGHPEPLVRRQVAGSLAGVAPERAAELAGDPDGGVRATALRVDPERPGAERYRGHGSGGDASARDPAPGHVIVSAAVVPGCVVGTRTSEQLLSASCGRTHSCRPRS
ncbi:hypothetical protein [Actinoplanes sp. NPDC020271]|uniref:hypothetical protein n=1 Tax=Actinoplanes sp. NPDC020271 TaxID=3363896 RepID=UPI00379E179E